MRWRGGGGGGEIADKNGHRANHPEHLISDAKISHIIFGINPISLIVVQSESFLCVKPVVWPPSSGVGRGPLGVTG